jgi:hypothetical protein
MGHPGFQSRSGLSIQEGFLLKVKSELHLKMQVGTEQGEGRCVSLGERRKTWTQNKTRYFQKTKTRQLAWPVRAWGKTQPKIGLLDIRGPICAY